MPFSPPRRQVNNRFCTLISSGFLAQAIAVQRLRAELEVLRDIAALSLSLKKKF